MGAGQWKRLCYFHLVQESPSVFMYRYEDFDLEWSASVTLLRLHTYQLRSQLPTYLLDNRLFDHEQPPQNAILNFCPFACGSFMRRCSAR